MWDYKRQPGGTQWQGNVNFGATGREFFPLDFLLRGAGAVQEGGGGTGHWTDTGPSDYGDELADIPHIKYGYANCRG
jgi:hypothetical protein